MLCCAVCCRWNPEGVAPPEEHGTSHFCVVDAERNAVSLTSSVGLSNMTGGSMHAQQDSSMGWFVSNLPCMYPSSISFMC